MNTFGITTPNGRITIMESRTGGSTPPLEYLVYTHQTARVGNTEIETTITERFPNPIEALTYFIQKCEELT